jgi:hypothetical protein
MRTREERLRARQERARERALAFNQCPFCTYDLATGEGDRACHYYTCPYLPDLLDVTCPECRFNFFTGEGEAGCGPDPSCEFARTEAPIRVAALTEWLERHKLPASTTR